MAEQKNDRNTDLGLPADVLAILDERCRSGESRLRRLAKDLQDYYVLLETGLRRARLLLTPAEAAAILDAHPRLQGGTTIWTGQSFARYIEEASLLDNVGEKWAVDCLALSEKLSGAGDEVCIALADWASAVLAKPGNDISEEIAIFKGGD